MQLLLKNEADYLVRQHTELRGGPLMNRLRLAVASYRASGFAHWPFCDTSVATCIPPLSLRRTMINQPQNTDTPKKNATPVTERR
jgi:hypothetical protein